MEPLSPGVCRGAAELRDKVLEAGLCSACGACAGFCPYIKTFGERVAVIQDCGLCQGVCIRVCPRLDVDYGALRRDIFGESGADPALGTFRAVYFARGRDGEVRSRGQYGGTVTALCRHALEQGLVDSTLAAGGGPAGAAPALCSSLADIAGTAGSKYTAVTTLSLYHQAVTRGFRRIGVVGRPCQVTAARKMERINEIQGRRIALVVGLFCFWALSPDFYSFLRERGLAGCRRMDIPKDGVYLTCEDGLQVKVDLTEVRPFIKESCLSCYDPLSELADVSVGSTEHDPEWNTLVVRTARGEHLVEEAGAAGVLELKSYPGDLLPLLKEAVLNKKKRVLAHHGAGYLRLPPGEKELLEGGGSQ